MSMYYRLYRRRHYLYLAALFLGLFCLFVYRSNSYPTESNPEADYKKYKEKKSLNKNNEKINNENEENNYEKKKDENNEKKKQRVNIFNYKIPEQCNGCPGENGQAVYLTVKYPDYLFSSC
jgi:sortase (surface protein transpeptidase)